MAWLPWASYQQTVSAARGRSGSVTAWAQPRLGSWLWPPWDWGLDPPVALEQGWGANWCPGRSWRGWGWGEPGLPLSPAPGHLGRDQGLRSPGSSLSQLAGDPPGPTGRYPAVGTAWHLSYRRVTLPPGHGACLPPSLQAQLGGGKGPDRFLQKRAKPRASPALPWLVATSRLQGSLFPKRDQIACFLAGGRGDSAGNCWGQELTSGLWHTQR